MFSQWLLTALPQNSTLAGVTSALQQSGAVVWGEQFPHTYFVPWFSSRAAFGHAVYLWLCVCAVVRCVNSHTLPMWRIELAWFVFGLTLVSVVLLNCEVGQQYDLFLFIPLGINAARVLSATDSPTLQSHQLRNEGLRRTLLSGVVVILVVCGAGSAVSAFLTNDESWTFATPVSETAEQNAVLDCSRFSCCLQPNPDERRNAREFVGSVRFSGQSLSGPDLRFLVSLDQRRTKMLWDYPDWIDEPLRYEILINGDSVLEGPLAELREAIWVHKRFEQRNVELTVTMRLFSADADYSLDTSGGLPSIAIEYVH